MSVRWTCPSTLLRQFAVILSMLAVATAVHAEPPNAVVELKWAGPGRDLFEEDLLESIMDGFELQLLARAGDLEAIRAERGMSGPVIEIGETIDDLAVLGELGADLLIRLNVKVNDRVVRREVPGAGYVNVREEVRATLGFRMIAVADAKLVDTGNCRTKPLRNTYQDPNEFSKIESLIEDATQELADCMTNENAAKIKVWAARLDEQRKAAAAADKIDDARPLRLPGTSPLNGRGVMLNTGSAVGALGSGQLRDFERMLQRDLSARGIRLLDVVREDVRRDGYRPVGTLRVTDSKLARSRGAAAICRAAIDGLDVERGAGAVRTTLRGSWQLIRATDGFSVASGMAVVVRTDRGESLGSINQGQRVLRLMDRLTRQLARKFDFAAVDLELDTSLRPDDIAVPVKIECKGLEWLEFVETSAEGRRSTAVTNRMIPLEISDATVRVDGIVVGYASDDTVGMAPGVHEVVIEKEGFRTWKQEIRIDGDSELHVFMEPTAEFRAEYERRLQRMHELRIETDRAQFDFDIEIRRQELELEGIELEVALQRELAPIRLEFAKAIAESEARVREMHAKAQLRREEAALRRAEANADDAASMRRRSRGRSYMEQLRAQQKLQRMICMHESIGQMAAATSDSGADREPPVSISLFSEDGSDELRTIIGWLEGSGLRLGGNG